MTSPTPPTSVVMTAEVAAALRAPFPPEKIGKLPRVTCRNCSKNYGSCSEHDKKWCDECNGMISPKHIHLDYVGHADTTDRFLEVDPGWNWEPVAFDQRGLPAFDEHGGLWIRLTIAGVTRLGYGDSQGKTGPNAVKEAIGDAFRNAGMRFGVALDLWRKDFPEAEEGPRKGGRAALRPPLPLRWVPTPLGSWPSRRRSTPRRRTKRCCRSATASTTSSAPVASPRATTSPTPSARSSCRSANCCSPSGTPPTRRTARPWRRRPSWGR
ncbi:hypothetical protein [Nonomuraea recticatena]|uniref:hypothetical protein n=1 Tax=Nonomuraea recticatena TaxID=46178 RepID=UPI00361CACC5